MSRRSPFPGMEQTRAIAELLRPGPTAVGQPSAALPNASSTRVSCSEAGEVPISPPFRLQLSALITQGTGERNLPGAEVL